MTKKTRKNSRSQLLAYKCLTKPQLGEIINAFQSNGNQKSEVVKKLENERAQIQGIDPSIQIETKFVTPKENQDAGLYINYKKNNNKVMHYSIHLCPKSIKNELGPKHFKQNKQTTPQTQARTIDVYPDPSDPNKVIFGLGDQVGENMNDPYKKEAEIVVKVLNEIWNNKPNMQSQKQYHPNLNKVYTNMQTALQKHNAKTRRRRIT
jgi:transcription termination factor Rho